MCEAGEEDHQSNFEKVSKYFIWVQAALGMAIEVSEPTSERNKESC